MDRVLSDAVVNRVRSGVDAQRLVETAVALIEIPSPTRSAGAVADRLAEILGGDGFEVERPVADWPEAPAVVVRFNGPGLGPTMQFDGHLDTVHLPFVPPHVESGVLSGSGASDMKGGVAALVEALRVLRETDALPGGQVLLTCHDHHEGPWGDRRQLRALIAGGYTADAVMIPEYLSGHLPLAGRGMAIFDVTIRRDGPAVHEVLRPAGTPDVLSAGVDLVGRLRQLDGRLEGSFHPHAGRDSVFVGKIASGEIYNQCPSECRLSGTRRWVIPGTAEEVEAEFWDIANEVADSTGVQITVDYAVQADAFRLEHSHPIVTAFQAAHAAVEGRPLPYGGKPFVDDGNLFAAEAGMAAITHGPAAKGAHTLEETVAVTELVRVAQVYALTAVAFCGSEAG